MTGTGAFTHGTIKLATVDAYERYMLNINAITWGAFIDFQKI